MSKQIIMSEDLKKLAKETITELAAVVKRTLGPGGNPIIIKRDGQNPDGSRKTPLITKDGVTVAEAIQFSDPVKDTIAQAIIQVAKDTVNEAGDGTTSSVVLAEAIYKAGYKYIENGQNSILLYEELKRIKDVIIQMIDTRKQDVTVDSIFQIAQISANGDAEIAQVIKDAIDSVGEDGHVTLEEGTSRETVLDIVEGAMYKQGYRTFGPLGSHMVTDKAKDICELTSSAETPVGVFLYGGKLDNIYEFADFLGRIYGAKDGKIDKPFPLLIVANDYSDEVKNVIMQNRVQGMLPIAAIKTPFDGSANARTGILEDLACLTGATVIAKGLKEISKATVEDLGGAEKIEIHAQETVIYGGNGDETEILERVTDLKRLLKSTPHDFDKDNIRIRIGKLTGGIAIIRVGGDSELEILEKKDRIEDALCAAKVALQDGIVPGGGTLFLELSEGLEPLNDADRIMKEALRAPFNQIVTNVGETPSAIAKEMEHRSAQGYNARTKEFVMDMVEEGIIDPAKVAKSALENAVSIAGLLLTTGGAITDEPQDSKSGSNPLAAMMGA